MKEIISPLLALALTTSAAFAGGPVVVEEEPWYLQAEALVSPHTNILDIEEWEKDRQGPAQNSQKVVYRFYSKR